MGGISTTDGTAPCCFRTNTTKSGLPACLSPTYIYISRYNRLVKQKTEGERSREVWRVHSAVRNEVQSTSLVYTRSSLWSSIKFYLKTYLLSPCHRDRLGLSHSMKGRHDLSPLSSCTSIDHAPFITYYQRCLLSAVPQRDSAGLSSPRVSLVDLDFHPEGCFFWGG